MGQKFLEEERAEALQHRKELAVEVERLQAEFEAALPALQDAEAKALAALERAREKLKAAQETHGQAVAAHTHLSNSHDMRRSKLEGELYSTASPAIRQFRGWLQDRHDALRRSRFQDVDAKRNAFGEPISQSGPTSYERLAEKLAVVRDAMKAAESLMLEPLDEQGLAKGLAELRQRVEA